MLISFEACVSDENSDIPVTEEPLSIKLRWFSGSFDQSEEEMKIGLAWALSFLGASLQGNALEAAIEPLDVKLFSINLSMIGFSENAQTALQTVIKKLKASDEYQQNGYTELGRFIMLTVNSSFHYYKITEIPPTIQSFRANHLFKNTQVLVINSSVANVNRLIEVAEANSYENIAYISSEGRGSFETGTFQPEEFEVMDFMPNGQIRFALYNEDGNLKSSANAEITLAGKPSKCMWCHESSIQPFFSKNPVLIQGESLSESEFLEIRDQQLSILSEYRKSLNSAIDYQQKQDHAFMEQIYIDFMEPSASRLAEEWGISMTEINERLSGLHTHTQQEFGIENLYDRKDIDQMGSVLSLEVPDYAREFSSNEPDFFGLSPSE